MRMGGIKHLAQLLRLQNLLLGGEPAAPGAIMSECLVHFMRLSWAGAHILCVIPSDFACYDWLAYRGRYPDFWDYSQSGFRILHGRSRVATAAGAYKKLIL